MNQLLQEILETPEKTSECLEMLTNKELDKLSDMVRVERLERHFRGDNIRE